MFFFFFFLIPFFPFPAHEQIIDDDDDYVIIWLFSSLFSRHSLFHLQNILDGFLENLVKAGALVRSVTTASQFLQKLFGHLSSKYKFWW